MANILHDRRTLSRACLAFTTRYVATHIDSSCASSPFAFVSLAVLPLHCWPRAALPRSTADQQALPRRQAAGTARRRAPRADTIAGPHGRARAVREPLGVAEQEAHGQADRRRRLDGDQRARHRHEGRVRAELQDVESRVREERRARRATSRNVAALLDTLKAHKILPIARIVVFKDSVTARVHPSGRSARRTARSGATRRASRG